MSTLYASRMSRRDFLATTAAAAACAGWPASRAFAEDEKKDEGLVQKMGRGAAEVKLDVQDGFIRNPELIDFYAERVKQVMESVSKPERVKKFLLLAKPFSVESDELTATLKVRRRHIIQKYEQQLAALYAAGERGDEGD